MQFNRKILPIAIKNKFEFVQSGFLILVRYNRSQKKFIFSTTIFSEEEFIPYLIRECIDIHFPKKLKDYKYYLTLEESSLSVKLIQRVPANSPIPFMQLFKLFIFSAKSWASILKRLAQRDFEYARLR